MKSNFKLLREFLNILFTGPTPKLGHIQMSYLECNLIIYIEMHVHHL